MGCPYYRRLEPNVHTHGVNGYCEAEDTWRIRVPSLFEEGRYCTGERYTACPVFRVQQGQLESKEDACTSMR
jgi:hypothetical protein